MPKLDPPPTSEQADAPPPLRVRPKPNPQNRPKRQPPYAVVLHNDSVNRFEWVIGVLMKVLRVGKARAFWLVLKTHVGGRGIVWTGTLELAELKAEQITAAGPDPDKVESGARPLKVTVEPLPD